MKITLVRHTAVDVPTGICYGQTDVPVATTFDQEAAMVKQKIQNDQFDIAFSSPLKRCVQLAAFCGVSPICIDDRLKEMDFGAWEMMRWDRIDDPQLAIWYNDWQNECATNGESFNQLIERTKYFIKDLLLQQKEQVLVFTHAGVIRAFLICLKMISPSDAFNIQVKFGEVITIDLV